MLNPTTIVVALSIIAGCFGYGYHLGDKHATNACEADKVAVKEALANALMKSIEDGDRKNKKTADIAEKTIEELQDENAKQESRIMELSSRIARKCDGHVVIDDQWMRDLNDSLTGDHTGTGD